MAKKGNSGLPTLSPQLQAAEMFGTHPNTVLLNPLEKTKETSTTVIKFARD